MHVSDVSRNLNPRLLPVGDVVKEGVYSSRTYRIIKGQEGNLLGGLLDAATNQFQEIPLRGIPPKTEELEVTSLKTLFIKAIVKVEKNVIDIEGITPENKSEASQVKFKGYKTDGSLAYTAKDKITAYSARYFYFILIPLMVVLQLMIRRLITQPIHTELSGTVPLDYSNYEMDEQQLQVRDEERKAFTKPMTLSNGKVVKNRLVKAGITDGLSDARGNPTEMSLELYRRYSKGGYGMIISPATSVDRINSIASFGSSPILDDESDLKSYQSLAAAMKQEGSLAILQLTQPGALVNPTQTPISPGPFISKSPYNIYPLACHVLSSGEIEGIIQKFVKSAQIAEQCGFDGIQIVAANGYLGSLFLSKNINTREDKWKGDNFVIELMRSLLQNRKSASFCISIKINSSDLQQGGLTQEESLETIKKLSALRLDFIEIGGGTYQNTDTRYSVNQLQNTSSYKRESFFIDFAERVTQTKDIDVPFITVGGWSDVKSMIVNLNRNPTMMIGFGRGPCIDPNLGKRLAETRVTKLPDWFELNRPKWITDLAKSDSRETRRTAFGIEMMWYAFSVSHLAKGHEIPKVKELFHNPLRTLAFRVFYISKALIPTDWKSTFFAEHPITSVAGNHSEQQKSPIDQKID